jgi:hypothetical protein
MKSSRAKGCTAIILTLPVMNSGRYIHACLISLGWCLPKVVRKPPEITFTPAPPVAPPPPVEPKQSPVSVTPATKDGTKYIPMNEPLKMEGAR